jgi:hypothetical protein
MLALFGSAYICEYTFSVTKLRNLELGAAVISDHHGAALKTGTAEKARDFCLLVETHRCFQILLIKLTYFVFIYKCNGGTR